jgi:predicted CopG family antitoxin
VNTVESEEKKTTIQVSDDTHKKLNKQRLVEGETFNSIISRLLEEAEKKNRGE